MNYLFKISYNGEKYSGWQSQPNQMTIQDTIASAVRQITGEFIRPVAISRTDAGVHAFCQFAQIKFPIKFDKRKLQYAINSQLPNDIRIISIKDISDDFRLHKIPAIKKYSYFVCIGERRPFYENRVWEIKGKLNEKIVKSEIKRFVGKHNFKSFQGQKCSRKDNTVRTMISAKFIKRKAWYGLNAKLYEFEFVGDGFLKHMIRNIVGLLVEVGLDKKPQDSVEKALMARSRKEAGLCAPAYGLYLVDVKLKE